MKLQWYGHACFLLTAENGTRILTDPCAPKTGHDLHDIACEGITSSHGHYDHNYFEAAVGSPAILNEAGSYELGGIRITALPCFHDEEQGAKRGTNLIFVYEIDGLRVAHLGDLGHQLSEELIAAIGKLDILLCPIGGIYTVDAAGAAKVAAVLQPKVFVPMHYKTPALTLNIGGLDEFLAQMGDVPVQKLNDTCCTFAPDTLPEKACIVVFDYAAC